MKYLYAKKVIALSVLLLTAISTMAISIKGTVVDDAKVPLPGVNVVIKGTTQGGVTDLDGKFEKIALLRKAALFLVEEPMGSMKRSMKDSSKQTPND